MRLMTPVLALVLGVAAILPLGARQKTPEPAADELRRETLAALKRAEAAPGGSVAIAQALTDAADLLDRVATRISSGEDRNAVREGSEALRTRARASSQTPFSAAALLTLVERVKIEDGPAPGAGLEFQGSYTQPTTKEPA